MSQETAEKAIQEALDRIYKKYGPNLGAFFSDVQRQLEAEKNEAEETQ